MSRHFIDTAVLETYRRSELEDRISKFANVCDVTIAYLNNLKATAQSLVNQLSCDCNPDHLRDSFLSCMSQVDEYNYIVSDFQLNIAKFGQLSTAETVPQQDTKAILKPMMAEDVHLMDLLSEPSTSTQKVSDNYSPKPLTKAEKIKLEESFIIFSSSNSIASTAESLCQTSEPRVVTVDKSNVQVSNLDRQLDKSDGQIEHRVVASSGPVDSDTQNVDSNGEMAVSPVIDSHSEDVASQRESNPSRDYESVDVSKGKKWWRNIGDVEAECPLSDLAAQVNGLSLFFRECNKKLPQQKLLTVDTSYNTVIIHIEDFCFYVITEDIREVEKFWYDMTQFYKTNDIRNATTSELSEFGCCAVFEPDSGYFYRAVSVERDGDKFYLYLVDMGMKIWCPLDRIFILMPQFRSTPPYAYFCQLSRMDLIWNLDKEIIQRCCNSIKKYLGNYCVIKVDDNCSEIYDVTVFLGNNITLNQLILSEALSQNDVETQAEAEESDFETEDALVAATGYNNKDEATNCEYATRGRPCPRGERCKLKHDVLFTDGWTLDRVEVVARLPEMPMPPVGTKVRVHVIEVCHFDRVCVHFLDNQPEEEPPKFGERFYPTTLTALVHDMNIQPERTNYKPLELEPAAGEVVAALYPPDGQVYRARVISVSRGDQTIQVKYLDYGNMMWVRSANVYQLSPLHCALPAQAVVARLAHITPLKFDNRYMADLRIRLSQLVLNKRCVATVVSHENDELIVKLDDESGHNVALQMATLGLVLYSEEQPSSSSPQKPSSRKQKQIIIPG